MTYKADCQTWARQIFPRVGDGDLCRFGARLILRHDNLNAKHALACGINLQSQLAAVQLKGIRETKPTVDHVTGIRRGGLLCRPGTGS